MTSSVIDSGAALGATVSAIRKFSKKFKNAPEVWGQYSKAIETLEPVSY
jgi:hypothetical protein